jgi:cytochrome b
MGTEPANHGGEAATMAVWDLPTRLFHWTLVALITLAWVTRKYSYDLYWHTLNGYAILVLIVWRMLWGFVGSSTSRFGSFLYRPAASLRYGVDFVLRRPRRFLGHSPLGSLGVLALLGLIGTQSVLGLFSYDDHSSFAGGPLVRLVSDNTWAWATKLHIRVFDGILVIIALHILAKFLYLVWKRDNLISAMVTGRKPAAAYEDAREAKLAGPVRALGCLSAAVGIVLGGILLSGGRLI